MRDKLFQKILDETPEETKIFVRLYADLVKRISYILDERGYSQASIKRVDKQLKRHNRGKGGLNP